MDMSLSKLQGSLGGVVCGVAVKYDLETKKRQQASSQKSLNFSIILIHRKWPCFPFHCDNWVMGRELLYSLTTKVTHLPTRWVSVQFSSVQSLSCVWLFVIPWIPACQASLTIINSWRMLKLMSIESVMPSNHLILCRLLLLPPIPPRIRVFSNKSTLCISWPKYWSFSFSICPSKEIPGLISFRKDPPNQKYLIAPHLPKKFFL